MSETAPALPLASLETQGAGWLLDCEYRQHSPRTLEERRDFLAKLRWLMERDGLAQLDPAACRGFLLHVSRGHLEDGGRWGNPAQRSPVKPNTLHSYYRRLRTFCCWLVKQDAIAASPVAKIDPPRVPRVRIQPFTDAEIERLLKAARRGTHPARDEALLLFLLDTGARVSELCAARRGDFDLSSRRCVVTGKGGKERVLTLGVTSARALWHYLNEEEHLPEAPLFLADRGRGARSGLTRRGVLDLFERLGARAGLNGVRCSPHTMRHSYSVLFLKAGGNVYQLQEALGHTSTAMTQRYVNFAAVDLEAAQRRFSPADRLKRR